jgi:hypothetical protein
LKSGLTRKSREWKRKRKWMQSGIDSVTWTLVPWTGIPRRTNTSMEIRTTAAKGTGVEKKRRTGITTWPEEAVPVSGGEVRDEGQGGNQEGEERNRHGAHPRRGMSLRRRQRRKLEVGVRVGEAEVEEDGRTPLNPSQ